MFAPDQHRLEAFRRHEKTFDELFAALLARADGPDAPLSPEGRQTLNGLRANISVLKASWIPIVERIQSNQSPEAIREAVLASEHTFDGYHFNKDVDKFVAQQNAYVLSQDQALVRLLPSSGLLVFVVGLGALILIGFLAFHAWFARHVLAPIAQFSHAADAISRGEITETVTIERNDEIGSLANSFGRMMTAVRFFQAEVDAAGADGGAAAHRVEHAATAGHQAADEARAKDSAV